MTHGPFSFGEDGDVQKCPNVGEAVGRRHSAPGKVGCENLSFSIALRIWNRLRLLSLQNDKKCDPESVLQSMDLAIITDAWICTANEERTSQSRRKLYLEDKKAISACMNALVQVIGIDCDGQTDACEFLYQALVRYASAPIQWSVAQLSSLMRVLADAKPGSFDTVRNILQAAEDKKSGPLRFSEAVLVYCNFMWKAFNDATLQIADADREHLSELLKGTAEEFANEVIDAMDLNPERQISCSAFMVCCLGRAKREVRLHQYDLTGGKARMMSFDKLEGVWHTGLVVYGREYFFNGDLVLNDPGATSFGTPTKISHMGYTHRRKKELHQWVVTELKPVFTRAQYDIFDNNCNHFTQSMAMWLCRSHLPDEVMRQADSIKKNPMLEQVLRPFFWFADLCNSHSASAPSAITSM